MGGVRPTPELLFSLAEGLANRPRPAVGEDPTQDGNRVAEQLGVRLDAASAFAFGTGEQVLSQLRAVIKQLTTVPTSSSLTDYLRRRAHRGEVWSLLEQFFAPAAKLPAMLWTHSVCWTDRCHAQANGAIIENAIAPNYERVSGSRPVELGFEPTRSPHRGPNHSKNFVVVRPSSFEWAVPQGMGRPRFMRYHEDSRVVVQNRDTVSFIHRERLGVAAPSVEHGQSLQRGIYPALDGKTYGLWRHPDTGTLQVTPDRIITANRNSPLFPIKVIDGSGIWDVQILKAHRYFDRPDGVGGREFRFDELTLNFERETPRLVWIGVLQDQFGTFDEDWFAKTGQGRVVARLSRM